MPLYSKESLETLRSRIDLAEVVSSYVKMQKSGSSYKGLCPFHDEKTPSFMIHKGDTHYHCFGCGAHGDAIAFLMGHVKMSFVEALETLSERFQVPLEKTEEEEKGPNKSRLKAALEKACSFYRFFLLHSEEGHRALEYLYARSIDLAFIKRFEIGYAPAHGEAIARLLEEEGFTQEEIRLAGLIRVNSFGRARDFFSERITFPVRDRLGAVIGFSARKFREEVFGGKYVNTAETPLFKKSQVLFGFCYSRQKIAKERRALIVEGQIDALRLIDNGFDFTVASQGTAFGEGHAKELLQLGVNRVYLALDGDLAGREAAVKIGGLFQSKGVEAIRVSLPDGSDPDSFLQEKGKEAFHQLLLEGSDYLSFYYRHLCKGQDLSSPSKKSEIVNTIASKIRVWEDPVLVHESLKKLSDLSGIPKEFLQSDGMPVFTNMRPRSLFAPTVDADRVLETDLLRWLLLLSEKKGGAALSIIQKNITPDSFKIPACRSFFSVCLHLTEEQRKDGLFLAEKLEDDEQRRLLNELTQKKINMQRAEEGVRETVERLLLRDWKEEGEKIQKKIQDGFEPEEEVLLLTKRFADLQKNKPKIH